MQVATPKAFRLQLETQIITQRVVIFDFTQR
jgi:hypothetical protein